MNRRTFLKRTAALGAVLALPARGVVAEAEIEPDVPEYATGGVITQPIMALISDSPEGCVVPLGADAHTAVMTAVMDSNPELEEFYAQFGDDIIDGIADGMESVCGEHGPESYMLPSDYESNSGYALGRLTYPFPMLSLQQLEDMATVAHEAGWYDIAAEYERAMEARWSPNNLEYLVDIDTTMVAKDAAEVRLTSAYAVCRDGRKLRIV